MSEPAKRFTIPGRGDVSEWDYQQWRRQCVDSYQRADFPARLVTWADGWGAGKVQPENADWKRYWQHVKARLDGAGVTLAFIGGRGTGKTQLATCAGRHVCLQGHSARYWRAAFLSENIKRGWDDKATESERKTLASVLRVRLLVVDEIGERNETEWERRNLTNIVCQRHDDSLDTILISNHDPDEFAPCVGDSIADRIAGAGVLVFHWQSFRRRGENGLANGG